MTTEIDWSLDYCLTCDRQTGGEAYCSQMCRLADLDNSTAGSEPSSPTASSHAACSAYSAATALFPTRNPGNGFHLPPAFDFSAYRRSSPSPPPPPPASASVIAGRAERPVSGYFGAAANTSGFSGFFQQSPFPSRSSTPSSSRSSLVISPEALSSQARSELRGYTESFDQVRDLKRRMTTS